MDSESAKGDPRPPPQGSWYYSAMLTTIDGAGRLVVPKRLREELGFKAGQTLELSAADGRLEIEHPATPMRLEKRGDRLVAVTDREMPALTSKLVRATLEQSRR
jgi:AbrB family looped-hinge helix DNA binding protein